MLYICIIKVIQMHILEEIKETNNQLPRGSGAVIADITGLHHTTVMKLLRGERFTTNTYRVLRVAKQILEGDIPINKNK